jgi:hypothetical protein
MDAVFHQQEKHDAPPGGHRTHQAIAKPGHTHRVLASKARLTKDIVEPIQRAEPTWHDREGGKCDAHNNQHVGHDQ